MVRRLFPSTRDGIGGATISGAMMPTSLHCALLPEQRAAERPGDRCVADTSRDLDNAAFAEAVRRLAARLAARGIGRGDVVAVMLPNCVELVTTMFAAWYVGAALTPINPTLTHDEVRYQLDDSAAVLVVADAAAREQISSVPVMAAETVFDEPGGDERSAISELAGPSSETDDPALIIYTSGTTGRPKGVILDHANLLAMSNGLIEHMHLTAADRSLLVLPLFHINGLVVGVLSVLRVGGNTLIAPRFKAIEFWSHVEAYRPTYFSAVPTIYQMLDALDPEIRPDTSSLRFMVCGAAPMSAELIRRIEDRYGVPLVEGYGLSEGTVASVINPVDGIRKPGTVGLPLPGQTVWVVDPDGRQLPPGERGEVIISGPNVMRGYLGRPQETADTVRDGWLYTGDIGQFDQDGYLTIVDRLKDMIIRGGENVYPKEIENVFYTHPAVQEVAVVGAPDALYGEQPVAFVSIRPGYEVTGDELIEHCRGMLAPFKMPRAVHIVPELPKNPIGKISKSELKEWLRKADGT